MRFNLFASSLIIALSAAVYIDADNKMSELDIDDTLMMTQVDSTAEWVASGKKKSEYLRPEDNCCYIYMGLDFTEPAAGGPLCWDKGEDVKIRGKSNEYGDKDTKFVLGVDCGKNTWVDLFRDKSKYY